MIGAHARKPMPNSEVTPPHLLPSGKALTLRPSFLRAWSGIWLLTWRTGLSWRRLPVALLGLLALPLLVYLTTASPRAWALRHPVLGNAPQQLNNFSRRLTRAQLVLQPEQRAQLQQIFIEEFARSQGGVGESASPEVRGDWRSEQVKACYDRIRLRAQPVLDERQLAQLDDFEQRKLKETQARAGDMWWGRTEPFYHWLIDFYFFMVLPLGCVRGCGALIRDELQADTLGFLTTRPLGRARLLVLKYLSQTAWLQLAAVLEAVLLFAAGQLRTIPALSTLLPLFLATQFLAVLAWSALGTVLGLATSRYLAMGILYGLFVEMGIGRIPTNINTLSMMRHLKTLLSHNSALQGIYEWTTTGVPLAVSALVLATVLFVGLAAFLFTVREYHHAAEMQK